MPAIPIIINEHNKRRIKMHSQLKFNQNIKRKRIISEVVEFKIVKIKVRISYFQNLANLTIKILVSDVLLINRILITFLEDL